MLEELLSIPDTFRFDSPASGGGIGLDVGLDVPKVGGLGSAHLGECLMHSEVVIIDSVTTSLHELLKVSASGLSGESWLVGSQELFLYLVPILFVDISIVERLPPD